MLRFADNGGLCAGPLGELWAVIFCDDHDERLAVVKDVALFKEPAFRGGGELAQIKLGRLGQVGGVMGALGDLASGFAGLVTGMSLIVDGGLTAD